MLKTTTQDERAMNPLQVNHFHHQMISNSLLYFVPLYIGESWSDAQWENKNLKKKITCHTKFWASGDAETYLHGTILPDFTIIHSK